MAPWIVEKLLHCRPYRNQRWIWAWPWKLLKSWTIRI